MKVRFLVFLNLCYDGTSFAARFVTGTIALLWSIVEMQKILQFNNFYN